MDSKTVLIIGCGIAGPVTALFLRQAGFTPLIYEGRPEPQDEAGFFLNLAPNGLAVLETLGIKDTIVALGTPTTSIAFLNHRMKLLGQNPETTILLKRGHLTRGLREAALQRDIPIIFGKRLAGVEVTPERTVTARFEDGSEAHGDILIGADGIHSRTRQLILPQAPRPVYTGIIDSGGFTHTPSVAPADGVMRMTFGLHGFFGYQVTPSGEIYWFENFAEPTEPERARFDAIPHDQWRQKLLDIHRHDHAPITEIIRSTERGIGRWPIYDMPALRTWHTGPFVLVGDAAHAISPHAGQGASLAMEDAMALAKCLRDIPESETAFATYERLRKGRVEPIVRAARRTGAQKVPSNALTRGIRDVMLPLFLGIGMKQAQQAYAYRLDWSSPAA